MLSFSLIFWKILRLVFVKKHANSNLNAIRSHFPGNRTVTLTLGLYVEHIIKINLHLKQNCKIVYYSLRNMSHRIGGHGDEKCQNLNSFFEKR